MKEAIWSGIGAMLGAFCGVGIGAAAAMLLPWGWAAGAACVIISMIVSTLVLVIRQEWKMKRMWESAVDDLVKEFGS